MRGRSCGYPAVAAKTEAGEVVGFAFLRPFHHADTFKRTAEIAYFILPEHTGKGLGRAIHEESLEFHRRHGFQEGGRFRASQN